MPKPRQVISFTEMSTLTQCEQKWDYKYEHKPDFELPGRSNALQLGTLLHAGVAAWWRSDGWGTALDEIAEADGLSYDEEPLLTAFWLLERYVEHYGSKDNDVRDTYEVVEEELELYGILPGTHTKVVGYVDSVIREKATGALWLLERKSMKDWSRLDLMSVDPQVTIYDWLARENDWPIKGIAYDAIRTYRWKRDQHAASESFDWLWLDRTQEQVDAAVRQFTAVSKRRAALRRKHAIPLRNVGPFCKTCDFKVQCFEDIAFPPFALELDEEE